MELTENQKYLISAGLWSSIPLAYFLMTQKVLAKAKVIVEASSGGTTEPSPGTYEHRIGTPIMVTAIPDDGYYFAGWTLDGASVGTENPITIKVEKFHTLIATFTSTPEDGGTLPISITPINVPIYVHQNFGGVAPRIRHYRINQYLDDWETVSAIEEIMIFKVKDAAGKGCGNIPVLLWTNTSWSHPDSENGLLLLEGKEYTAEHQLELRTLSNGEVHVPLTYWSANINELSKKYLKCWLWKVVGPALYPVYSCFDSGVGWYIACGGEHKTILLPNFVYARVKGTALEAIGSANCQIHIKHAHGP